MVSIKGWRLGNIKPWVGREWDGVQGDLYFNGKKVGWYSDDGNGGQSDFEFFDKNIEKKFNEAINAYFKDHPIPLYENYQMSYDIDAFVSEFLLLKDKEKEFKRLQKIGFPIMLVLDSDGSSWDSLGLKTEAQLERVQNDYKKRGYRMTVFRSKSDFNIL